MIAMKISLRGYTLIASFFFLIILASHVRGDAALRFGYVDTESVLQASTEFIEIDREARFKIELKEEEGQKKFNELRRLQEQMAVLAEDKREELMQELFRRRQELIDFQENARQEILERQSVDLNRIATKIQTVIERVSREMNMTAVFDKKPLLYVDRTRLVDLTQKVIDELNKDFENEKERLRRRLPERVR